jgi:hypothetical protein
MKNALKKLVLVVGLIALFIVPASAEDSSAAADIHASPSAASDETSADKSESQQASDLAKETQNPVANLISVPFQNNFNFNLGPNHVTQYDLNIQPVIPISLSKDWNLITRTIMPIISQPSAGPGIPSAAGLGDINPTFFLSPAGGSKKIIWGVGPTFTFPTATQPILGNQEWTAGPAVVVLTMQGPWVVGLLANQQWSFAGWGNHDVSAFLTQPFVNYNLPHGWYLSSSPIITANWEVGGRDAWVVPLGGGVGKLQRFGKLPVNFQLQAFGNVVRPSFGPTWQLRFQIQFLFPK